MSQAQDFDAPKPSSIEAEDSLDDILTRKPEAATSAVEEEDPFEAEVPGGEEITDELSIKPLPIQANEFTCRRCFLVKHRSQLANAKRLECRDCA